jgi:hypothetical protein
MDEYEVEIKEIDRTTSALYLSICFEEERKPDLDKLRALFIPLGILINNAADAPVIMTVDEFIDAFNQQLSSGSLKSFHEAEISSRTEVFGKIAHRFSTYEAKFDPKAPEPFCVGINSIQFIKLNETWLVSSMVWNDQTEELRIPQKYL